MYSIDLCGSSRSGTTPRSETAATLFDGVARVNQGHDGEERTTLPPPHKQTEQNCERKQQHGETPLRVAIPHRLDADAIHERRSPIVLIINQYGVAPKQNKSNMKIKTSVIAAAMCLPSSTVVAFQSSGGRIRLQRSFRRAPSSPTAREMKSSTAMEGDERKRPSSSRTSLFVATLQGAESLQDVRSLTIPQLNSIPNMRRLDLDAVTKVLSASLLVTGNTVGSSMFVLPEAVGGVGYQAGTMIFVGKCSRWSGVCLRWYE